MWEELEDRNCCLNLRTLCKLSSVESEDEVEKNKKLGSGQNS